MWLLQPWDLLHGSSVDTCSSTVFQFNSPIGFTGLPDHTMDVGLKISLIFLWESAEVAGCPGRPVTSKRGLWGWWFLAELRKYLLPWVDGWTDGGEMANRGPTIYNRIYHETTLSPAVPAKTMWKATRPAVPAFSATSANTNAARTCILPKETSQTKPNKNPTK